MFHGFRLALKPIVQHLSTIVNNVSPTTPRKCPNHVTIRESTDFHENAFNRPQFYKKANCRYIRMLTNFA